MSLFQFIERGLDEHLVKSLAFDLEKANRAGLHLEQVTIRTKYGDIQGNRWKGNGQVQNKLQTIPTRKGDISEYKPFKGMGEAAKKAYEHYLVSEPKITKDFVETVRDIKGASLTGLKHRMKTAESYDRKIKSDVKEAEGRLTEDEVAGKIYDAVRYTVLAPPDRMVDVYNDTISSLESKGYTLDRVKNTWNKDSAYMGINTVLTHPSGDRVELQFHTPESLEHKGVAHKLYEEQRQDDTTPERKKELDIEMKKLAKRLTFPPKIDTIKVRDYLKKPKT